MEAIKRKELITSQVVQVTGRNLTQLQSILRWSSYIADTRFNELNKQGMNAVITYVLAIEAKEAGKEVDMTEFPKIILHRVFEKLFLCDIREDFIDRILKLGNIDRERFDAVIEECIEKEMGKDFAKFIKVKKDSLEMRIFQAAMKLATKMELYELRRQIPEEEYLETIRKIETGLNEYNDLPGFSRISVEYSKEMKLFRQISALRNRIRWSKRLGTVNCAVLGHNFEVAVLSYMMALKEYEDEEIATKIFFTGAFHDVPETFTGDMPSPVKDAIPGLRKATEYFELEMINTHIYANFPEYLREAMHGVMMEEAEQERYKALIKRADYLSADFECLRNIIAGSRDPYFEEVIERDISSHTLTDVFDEALEAIASRKSF